MTQHWKYVTLDNAVKKGSSNISLNKIQEEMGEYPVYGAKGFVKNVSFFQQEQDYLAIIKDGAGIGRVSKHPAKSSVLATMQYLVPKDGFDIGFIGYFLNSIDFEKYRNGSTIPHIYFKDYKNVPIPMLPLEEQKRIVAILDEAFAGIDTAIANTEKNLANARELFESYLNNIFTIDGEGWESVKLKDISTKITDGVHKKPHYVENGVPFIKINNLTAGPGISFEGVSYISKEDHELFCKRTNPEKGDILITKDGTIGIVRIVDTDVEFSIFVSVALIKPIDKSSSPYLKYVLESPLIQNQIKPQGAALKHLYLRDLREYLVPLPPKEVQDKIVEELDSFSVESYRLESIYQQKLNSLKELKQSLLQKAFSGGLTSKPDKLIEEAVA
ncbi:MAG: restriction endonuclease subunit S [Gammaproteobacteria bacterium]|nr:restriction endonuclease subunit S [Gammaproteobacteria bacterium]